jgi:hypothetical protein
MLALKPDGLFLAAILGGETLKSLFLYILLQLYLEHQYMFPPFLWHFAALRELRIACTVAQMEREGGISPRVSPLAQVCIMAQLIYLLGKVIRMFNEEFTWGNQV